MEIRTEDTSRRTHLRKLVVKGEEVSRLVVLDLEMRIGSVHVRTGGIGGMETKKEHRLRGYARRLMEDTVRWMNRSKYVASLLFGMPDFYYRFGYATCMGEYEVATGTNSPKKSKQIYKVRKLLTDDRKDILNVYEKANIFRSCTIVRRNSWRWFGRGSRWEVKPDDVEGLAVEDSTGDFLGYLAYDRKDGVNVVEANATQDEYAVYGSALARLSEIAAKESASVIKIYVPIDHPIIEVLKTFGCGVHASFHRNAFGLMRIVNLESTFREIKGELERRIQASKFKSELLLSISTDIGLINLNIKNGKVRFKKESKEAETIKLGQNFLSQLLVGYKKPQQILYETRNIGIKEKTKDFFESLCSEYEPYTWMADLF